MSGSIAAIAAYNGTGTQGHGTTDKQQVGVKSVFWNDYDTGKHFVNGCTVSEVSSNKGTIESAETIVFTFDNDIDAISDLELVVEVNTVQTASSNPLASWWMSLLIERVEICVGNQVISTINTAGLIKSFIDAKNPSFYVNKKLVTGIAAGTTYDPAEPISSTFKLPIFNTLDNDVDCSYLMGLANNQTLQVKVYPQNLTKDGFNENTVSSYLAALGSKFTFRLFANKCTMTNAERNLLKNQVVPKRTNITQSATTILPNNTTTTPPTTYEFEEGKSITINCDHFNIYADALYVVAAEMKGGVLEAFDIEVFLNSSSYSGILPPEITQKLNAEHYASATMYADDVYYYKIPLANLAMSKDQDFVPLGKYDSIRVVLTPTLSSTPTDTTETFKNTLSVIATGKTTSFYQNGAVTFTTF